MKKLIIALALGSICLTAPALAGEDPTRPETKCFHVHKLRNFSYIDDYHALFEDSVRRKQILVGFTRKCREIRYSYQVSTSFDGSTVCSTGLEWVNTRDDRCPVKYVQQVKDKDEAKSIASARAEYRQQKKQARLDRKAAKKLNEQPKS